MRVRISARAHDRITADVGRWPNVETGGVLLGRQSDSAGAFYVSDVLDAPPDSTRTAGLFELGTQGLQKQIKEYLDRHKGTLYCLGTWHSHLAPQGASPTDRNTAKILGLSRAIPSVMLIHTPAGYRAILAG
jgi:integrative and conjugative element protein (TIGR02256 family)